MSADPADIAKFTSDGVVVSATDTALRDAHPDAQEADEIEMFYDAAADAATMLAERFGLRSKVAAVHEAVEVEEGLGLGSTVALAPTVPCFAIVDESRQLAKTVRTRAYVFDAGTDRYSVEVIE